MDDLQESTKVGMRANLARIAGSEAMIPMIEPMFAGTLWNLFVKCEQFHRQSLAQGGAQQVQAQVGTTNTGTGIGAGQVALQELEAFTEEAEGPEEEPLSQMYRMGRCFGQ